MSAVKICFLTPFNELVEENEFTQDFKEGETFRDLIDKLIILAGEEFKSTLFDNGAISEDVAVLKNGMNVCLGNKDSGFSMKLNDGEEFLFCTAMDMG
ncbi:MAG: MoaD/ThiS family protein [archaeon]|nr:MoaD/ThiS family protein [archaeon]